jgi:hypothetical protein
VDSYEALTGKNLITGEPLDSFERSMAILGLATLGFSSKLTKGIKWLSKIIAPTKMGTKALGMAERVLDTAQRIVGNDKGKVATFLRNVKDGNWSKVFEATPPSKILDAPHVQKKFRSDLGVPNTWVSKKAKKGDGLIFHESNNIHTDIRVMPGKKDSPFPNSQKPYIEFKKNGIYLDKFGNQLPNNRNEAAHIPLGEFKFNR